MKNNLKVLRAMHDMTQQQLSERAGVSRQTINSIETGRYIPSTELALKLSVIFGKTVNEIFQLD
ncbi:MAG: helix-turn-helix transcriptional regulator [Bacteroidales bacterium]|nr:helix-turn-helix transcriptional regulator [Bacteroidales bacterium]